jgi:D-threo-aldose 1-dehydrogenase
MTRFVPPGPLGCGGAPLGNLFAPIPEEAALATLEAAWAVGIRHFDTAPFYGFGLSEHRFGQVLRQRPRDSFTLSTKVGRLLIPDPAAEPSRNNFHGGLSFRAQFDYSADATRRSIEHSLQRLGVAQIDIIYIHDVGEDTHGAAWRGYFDQAMAGAARVLTELRSQGVIKAWGLGVNLVEPCRLALEEADPDVFLLAGRYTLLDTASLDTLLPACAARDVRIVIGGPYNSGLLAGGGTYNYEPAPAEMISRRDRMAALCAQHTVDLKAAALQFCTAHPVVAAAIPGARSVAEMQQNAAMMAQPIPAALWQDMKQQGLIPQHAPTPPGR